MRYGGIMGTIWFFKEYLFCTVAFKKIPSGLILMRLNILKGSHNSLIWESPTILYNRFIKEEFHVVSFFVDKFMECEVRGWVI